MIYLLFKGLILMLNIENHFLDANMVLSVAFKDSDFDVCLEYYKLDYTRHLSYNVKKEIYQVIERLRIISFGILYFIQEHISSNSIPLYNLDYHINIVKNNYLNHFKDENYVYGIKREKFVKVVEDLFIRYYDEIRNSIIANDTELIILFSKIEEVFGEYDYKVAKCLSNFEIFNYENNHDLIKSLIDIGFHKKDAILVDDCCNRSLNLRCDFVFVTQDDGIIESSYDAHSLLDSKVYFSKPSSFLNN